MYRKTAGSSLSFVVGVVMVQRMHNVALNWSIGTLEEVNGYLERGTKWHDILDCLYSSSMGALTSSELETTHLFSVWLWFNITCPPP